MIVTRSCLGSDHLAVSSTPALREVAADLSAVEQAMGLA